MLILLILFANSSKTILIFIAGFFFLRLVKYFHLLVHHKKIVLGFNNLAYGQYGHCNGCQQIWQQTKGFGHVIRQRELNITQRVVNKKFGNTRPKGRPRKRWIGGILEDIENITAEEAIRRANHRNLSLPSTLRSNLGREEEEEWLP
jgi:hypothetical protein